MRYVKRIASGLKDRIISWFLTVISLPEWKEKLLVNLKYLSVFTFFLAVLFVLMVAGAPFIREQLIPGAPEPLTEGLPENVPAYLKQINKLRRDLTTQVRRYESLTPGQNYLVINTTGNRFYLYRHRTLKREGYCSSGSYIQLRTHDEREWIFRTPRGVFRIQGKTKYPVWKKPDWAFIEEGLPVPSSDHYSRFEYGALGDYALNIGDGYLIHGTLYKRSLGMPVTHGCVRLNDEDLEYVFNALNIGSKVYIY
ncbi:MAG: L,D-transpeptidase [Bacteroidales bacterium]|jgi:lipoprotein-anchoring transpeptidase ErfK/SrfK|nr:L,D-transpeptidase [Bacteroidales bacterium]